MRILAPQILLIAEITLWLPWFLAPSGGMILARGVPDFSFVVGGA